MKKPLASPALVQGAVSRQIRMLRGALDALPSIALPVGWIELNQCGYAVPATRDRNSARTSWAYRHPKSELPQLSGLEAFALPVLR